jgi:hypothetical protein
MFYFKFVVIIRSCESVIFTYAYCLYPLSHCWFQNGNQRIREIALNAIFPRAHMILKLDIDKIVRAFIRIAEIIDAGHIRQNMGKQFPNLRYMMSTILRLSLTYRLESKKTE